MRACGIIVEYNPFHNGHAYHAHQARELSHAEVVVAVMSGNFLQRGEPAIVDKWSRADAAIANGVDLVIELPVAWSLQSADYFAAGGVKLLQALQCEALCFGTDTADEFDYQAFGEFFAKNQAQIDQRYQKITDQKLAYPQKMQQVLQELYPPLHLDGQTPNHILALSYAQANASYPQPMELFPLPRLAADFHGASLPGGQIASATAIRQALLQQDPSVSDYLPTEMGEALAAYHVTWNAFWPYLKYRILTMEIAELKKIYQMVDGLEYRLKAAVNEAMDFTDFLTRIKSKRYTWTRLQRLLCYVLLTITTDEIKTQWQQPYLHPLAFNQRGQQYLKSIKKNLSLPLINRIGQKTAGEYALSIKADQVYQLADPRIPEQNFGRFPIIQR